MRRNFHRILDIDIDSPQGRRLAENVYRNQVVCALEAIRSIHQPELVKIEGLAEMRSVFERAEAGGKGQLLVTAHLGSWEIIEVFMPGLLKGKFYELAKPMRIKAFTRHLEKLRLRAGTHVVWNNQKLLLRKMLRILRAGDTLGLACDQKPKQLLGPVVEFFGRPTEFVGGPGSVAERTGCAVIAVFCTRLGSFTYRLTTEVLFEPTADKRDARAVTQRIAHSIEDAVRRTPDQWPWTYRRWIYEDDEWNGPRGEARRRAAKVSTEPSSQSSSESSSELMPEEVETAKAG